MDYDMKTHSLTMRNIFAYMMENGYSPNFEDGYILFDIDDNTSVLEYENGVLTLRTFFTIDKEGYEMFLEASNFAMIKSFMIKPVIMEDMNSIMFSCETFCQTMGDFKRFFPLMIEYLRKGMTVHKTEMRELLKAVEMLSYKKPAADEQIVETGIARGKLLS
jgi:hypothetical protein